MDKLKKLKEIQDYKKEVKGLSVDELKEREKELIAEADNLDKEVKDVEYDLPTENWKEACSGIRQLLNKKTITWEYAFTYVSIYDFWNPEDYKKKIKYPMLDATLNILGELQFTGYSEWAAVVAVNKYFEVIRPLYAATVEKVFDIASKHSAILDELKLKSPVDAQEIPDSLDVQ